MLRLDKVIKPWRDAASLNDHINLYGFWNETTFLTKSGDLGMVLRVPGVDYESLDHAEQEYAVKRLEAALKAFGPGFHTRAARHLVDATSARHWLASGVPVADVLTMLEVRHRFELSPQAARVHAMDVVCAVRQAAVDNAKYEPIRNHTDALSHIACGERLTSAQYEELMRNVKTTKRRAAHDAIAQFRAEAGEERHG